MYSFSIIVSGDTDYLLPAFLFPSQKPRTTRDHVCLSQSVLEAETQSQIRILEDQYQSTDAFTLLYWRIN